MKPKKNSPVNTLHREIDEANSTLPKRRSRDGYVEVLIAALSAIGKGKGFTKLQLALGTTEDDLEQIAKKYGSMLQAGKELIAPKKKNKLDKTVNKAKADSGLTAALKKIISALEAGTTLDEAQRANLDRILTLADKTNDN